MGRAPLELSPAFAAGPELVVPAECMRTLTELFVLQRDELRVVQRGSGAVRSGQVTCVGHLALVLSLQLW